MVGAGETASCWDWQLAKPPSQTTYAGHPQLLGTLFVSAPVVWRPIGLESASAETLTYFLPPVVPGAFCCAANTWGHARNGRPIRLQNGRVLLSHLPEPDLNTAAAAVLIPGNKPSKPIILMARSWPSLGHAKAPASGTCRGFFGDRLTWRWGRMTVSAPLKLVVSSICGIDTPPDNCQELYTALYTDSETMPFFLHFSNRQ
jgi:hypothetical protein